ncbi:MAG TPA: LamG domain-containing protein [Flavihumibacter sp.]|nr:LamG domain-containing protein [Bacteroidota bacterium]HQD10629.1 LamG domain-containing protein [Flavihumibacter sp.]
MRTNIKSFAVLTLAVIALGSCQKMNHPALGDYPKDANAPGGPLKFYAAMDGTTTDMLRNAVDSIRALFPSQNGGSSVDGISGKAVQGADKTAILYPSANDFGASTSFTISMWLKKVGNTRAEFIFSLIDDRDTWVHNSLFLMEEAGNADSTALKFYVRGQWLAWEGDHKFKKPLADGQWHHLAISYNEATSKLTWYFDGAAMTNAVAAVTDVKNGANPLGPIDLSGAKGLIVAGNNQHVGQTGAGDDWIKSYTGAIDQFRLYGTLLTDAEVKALYDAKK